MRVVLDPNVLIAALLSPSGAPAQIISRWLGGGFELVVSKALLSELTEIDDRLVLRSLPDLHAEDFALLLRRYGVELVVEKVENERQVVDILDLDISLAQGHLFGEPRAIKDAVLAEAGPPPATVVQMPLRRAAVG